ncbi:hypothetical protein Tco_0277448 [Tanacetum coccineum]
MATLNEPIPQGTGLGSGLRRQDTIMRDRPAQTRFDRFSKQSNEPPLSRVNTLGSGEDSMKLNELMEICTKLFDKVLDLEKIKDDQALEIKKLKTRVKKLEKKKRKEFGNQEDAVQTGEKMKITQDERISMFSRGCKNSWQCTNSNCWCICSTAGVTTASVPVTTASPTRPVDDSITDDITLAETLMKIKSSASRPQKAKGFCF